MVKSGLARAAFAAAIFLTVGVAAAHGGDLRPLDASMAPRDALQRLGVAPPAPSAPETRAAPPTPSAAVSGPDPAVRAALERAARPAPPPLSPVSLAVAPQSLAKPAAPRPTPRPAPAPPAAAQVIAEPASAQPPAAAPSRPKRGLFGGLLARLSLADDDAAPARAAEADARPATAAPPALKAPTGEAPAMWRIADEDSVVHLFGTFHLLPDGVAWRTPAYRAAMAASPVTVVEADVDSADAELEMRTLIIRHGLNPPGVTLSAILGPERARRLQRVANDLGVPMATLEPQRPWLALIGLAAVAMERAGYDADRGVETVVLAEAAREEDAIVHLETLEFQIKALASLDETEMLGNFDASIAQFDDFEALAERMLDAWRRGDVAAVDELVLGDLRRDAPGAYRILITDRNRRWVREIMAMLEADEDHFVAVGAGHLAGEQSIVSMLRALGYAVERVQ